MNVDTGRIYVAEDERMLALMRGENVVPVEQVVDHAQHYSGPNRAERRREESIARKHAARQQTSKKKRRR